jgi:serine/threonine protein kinase
MDALAIDRTPAPEGPKASLEPGEELAPGRRAVELLGGGPSHEAFLCWDDHLHALVVAKALRPERANDRAALSSLTIEGQLLRRLNHPVIPRLFDADFRGARPYLLLEFLEGPRLSTLIRRHGWLPVEQVLPLAVHLTSALHYLHAEGVVHLDLKPKNVIMAAPPRLIDLSIATTVERAARMRSARGTDPYMPPEQCDPAGLGPVTPAADVWSLGVTLFEALTGERPFARGSEDADGVERWPQLAAEPAPLPRTVPDMVGEPVMACLRRDAGRRPTATELAGVFAELSDRLPKYPQIGRLRPRSR